MHPKNITRLGITALLTAWSFDLLFWGKTIGISFPLFILLCLLMGFYLTWRSDLPPAKNSFILVAGILFFAWIPFLRLEPFTVFTSIGLAVAGLIILSLTWRGGCWWRYDLGDYALNLLRWLRQVLTQPGAALASRRDRGGDETGAGEQENSPHSSPVKITLSILLGLLLALPVVVVLAALLAMADPIFSRLLEDALSFLRFEQLVETIFRISYILILAYLLCGAFLYALLCSQDEKVHAQDEPRLKPFLGWLEAGTLLACVDLLFSAFVAVQVRYFFGGGANIRVDGYTFAEYARRGFGELVIAAFLSMLLLWGLSMLARREPGWQRRAFSFLGILLVGLVGVILISAYQRLLLYEAAYGFTRLRVYTHVFMIWLGVLLAGLALLEAAGRMRYFALALLLVVMGFGGGLALMNVDGTIAQRNVVRAAQGEELDTSYLVRLSEDAAPYLFDAFESQHTPAGVREQLGGVLACRAALAGESVGQQPWQAFHWSREQALRLYQQHGGQLEAYPVHREQGRWQVRVGGVERNCRESWGSGD